MLFARVLERLELFLPLARGLAQQVAVAGSVPGVLRAGPATGNFAFLKCLDRRCTECFFRIELVRTVGRDSSDEEWAEKVF